MLNDTVKGRTRKLIVFLSAKVILFSLEEKSGSLTWGLKMFVNSKHSSFFNFPLLYALGGNTGDLVSVFLGILGKSLHFFQWKNDGVGLEEITDLDQL